MVNNQNVRLLSAREQALNLFLEFDNENNKIQSLDELERKMEIFVRHNPTIFQSTPDMDLLIEMRRSALASLFDQVPQPKKKKK